MQYHKKVHDFWGGKALVNFPTPRRALVLGGVRLCCKTLSVMNTISQRADKLTVSADSRMIDRSYVWGNNSFHRWSEGIAERWTDRTRFRTHSSRVSPCGGTRARRSSSLHHWGPVLHFGGHQQSLLQRPFSPYLYIFFCLIKVLVTPPHTHAHSPTLNHLRRSSPHLHYINIQ